jgi:hypothetical protein
MNAVFMLLQQHGRGIHAVRARYWRGDSDESPSPAQAAASGGARAEADGPR